jgi:hypothetical protein
VSRARRNLKRASFAHSTVYACLLTAWAIPGLHPLEFAFGLAHGLGWFAMCGLMVWALRRRIVDLRLATAVAILGAVGPFIGSYEFVQQDRQDAHAAAPQAR